MEGRAQVKHDVKTKLESMHEQIEKIHTGAVDHVNADILHRYIDLQSGALDSAWADCGAWEAAANAHRDLSTALKLEREKLLADVKTHRQFYLAEQQMRLTVEYRFEQAMKCINRIDDLFEYAYKNIDKDILQKLVRASLATFTDAVKPKSG